MSSGGSLSASKSWTIAAGSNGSELAVDADHAHTSVVGRSDPDLVSAAAADLRPEPLLGARHRERLSIVYRHKRCHRR